MFCSPLMWVCTSPPTPAHALCMLLALTTLSEVPVVIPVPRHSLTAWHHSGLAEALHQCSLVMTGNSWRHRWLAPDVLSSEKLDIVLFPAIPVVSFLTGPEPYTLGAGLHDAEDPSGPQVPVALPCGVHTCHSSVPGLGWAAGAQGCPGFGKGSERLRFTLSSSSSSHPLPFTFSDLHGRLFSTRLTQKSTSLGI